jgi:hypothetical protein
MAKTIDLFASKKLSDSFTSQHQKFDEDGQNMLVWKKIEMEGYRPSAREGHSSVSCGSSVIVFGGFEASVRVNSTLCLDIVASKWKVIKNEGQIPCARNGHACCCLNEFVLIHGGEGINNELQTKLCPGDVLTGNLRPKSIYNGIENKPEKITSLDDFHVLRMIKSDPDDINSPIIGTWNKINCSLAPLPRTGHTITNTKVKSKDSILVFGGYSRETGSTSNSLHIVSVNELSIVLNAFKDDNKKKGRPITWRTVNYTGQCPSPRYRHTATVVSGSFNAPLLTIFGGIGSSGNLLGDIHALDLETLVWSNLQENSPQMSLSNNNNNNDGDGGSPVFGHISISTPKYGRSGDHVLLVFGGNKKNSTDVKSSACSGTMHSYDIVNKEWSKTQVGYTFPNERYGHSLALLTGWSPSHIMPSFDTPVSELEKLPVTSFDQTYGDKNPSCAIIFGGSNSVACYSDVWVLDLRWRPMGVQQFDLTSEKRTKKSLKHQISYAAATQGLSNTELKTGLGLLAGGHNNPYEKKFLLQKSQSESALKHTVPLITDPNLSSVGPSRSNSVQSLSKNIGTESIQFLNNCPTPNTKSIPKSPQTDSDVWMNSKNNSTKWKDNGVSNDVSFHSYDYEESESFLNDIDDVGQAFLKVRRERAVNDVALQFERVKNIKAEEKIKKLENKLLESDNKFKVFIFIFLNPIVNFIFYNITKFIIYL